MVKKYIKYSLANGGGGELLGSKPVMMYSPQTENHPSDNTVVRLANERFPQETPHPLYIYKVDIVELNVEQIAQLNTNPKYLI